MDRIISCASRVSWLGTPQGIDLSVITRAVWASEKLHPEVLSFKDRIQFLCTVQERTEGRRERYGVSDLYYKPETEEQADIDSMLSIISTGGWTVPPYGPVETLARDLFTNKSGNQSLQVSAARSVCFDQLNAGIVPDVKLYCKKI